LSAKRKVKKRTSASAPSRATPQLVPTDLLMATAQRAQRTGDLAAAERSFRQVIDVDPNHVDAVQSLGVMLCERGEIDAAIDLFESVESTLEAPSLEYFGFWNNYANALRRADRPIAAEKILTELTEVAPRKWQVWHNLGQALKEQERYSEAAAALRRAVLLEPTFGANHGVLGEVLHNLGRLNSAQASFKRGIELGAHGDDHALYTFLANNQRLLGQLDESLETVMLALTMTGGAHAAHSNAGVVLMTIGRFDEAVEHFEIAIAQDPDNNMYQGYLSYALLSSGRIAEAMDSWERGKIDGPRGATRKTTAPTFTLDDTDVRVMVYREQGVGDEIMLASMYPDLIAAAREVVIECDSRLVTLFARSFPDAEVREQTQTLAGETTFDYDRVLPAGNLMRPFRSKLEDFPGPHAYLVPDPEKVDAWKERLAEAGPGPYVGITWRSRVQTAERRLEYTRLEEWGDIFGVPGITWVNLQYDDCDRELHDAEQQFGVTIHRWSWLDYMNDFDEVAALNANLDLVVAPFNAAAMLSGALGVRTVAMGNRHGWSEMATGGVPFVPAIVGALRMPNESWDDVLAQAAREVREVAAHAVPHV
jgi:tetratricopeptide (TPR) repeat protein